MDKIEEKKCDILKLNTDKKKIFDKLLKMTIGKINEIFL